MGTFRVRTGRSALFAAVLVVISLGACDLGEPPTTYATQGRLAGTGDVDGDGNTDLVVAGTNSEFGVLFGDGTGVFSPLTAVPHEGVCDPTDPTYECGPVNVSRVVDVNSDGLVDVVVSHRFRIISEPPEPDTVQIAQVRLADGAGTFGPPIQDPFGGLVGEAGDVTGDGHVDLVTTSDPFTGPLTLSVRPGDGQGHFAGPVQSDLSSLGSRIPGVRLADVNGDDLLDVVLDGICVQGTGELLLRGCVDVMLSDGTAAFAGSTRLMAGDAESDGLSAAIADLDEDGDADIVASGRGSDFDGGGPVGALSVWLGDGAGGFGPETPRVAFRQTTGVQTADFDADGHVDLLTTTTNDNADSTDDFGRILFGDGAGAFPEGHVFGSGTGTIDDLDADGRPDIVMSSDTSVSVFMNRWDGRPD